MDQTETLATYPWLKIELFQRILQKEFPKNEIHIQNFTVKAALAKGENFTSQMLRSTVTYSIDEQKNNEIRFIIKAAVSDLNVRAVIDELEFFHKEITNFEIILPEVYKLLEGIGDHTKMSAKCYETSAENSYIIFEDLTARGYANSDKKNGLTVKQYELILKKLARWYAANAVLKEQKFKPLEIFTEHAMNKNNTFEKMMISMLEHLSSMTKTMPGYEKVSKKFKKSMTTFYPKMKGAVETYETDFLTLCHGDLWSNNIMFTTDSDGNSIDAILVDYQVSSIGSAVVDLANTLYSSSHNDVRSDDYDYLVQYYHQELKETLVKLNYSKPFPTLTELQAQLLLRGVFYSVMGVFTTGMRSFDKIEDMDMAVLTSEKESDRALVRTMLENVKNNEGFKFRVKYFDRRGYFD